MRRGVSWLLMLLLLTARGALAVDLSPLDRFETGAIQSAAEPTSEPESDLMPEPEPVPAPARTPRPTATPDPNAPFFRATVGGALHEFSGAANAYIYTNLDSRARSQRAYSTVFVITKRTVWCTRRGLRTTSWRRS